MRCTNDSSICRIFVQPGEFSFRWGLEKNMSSFRLHGRLVLSAEHCRLTNLQPREPTGRRSSWIRSWRGRASQQLLRWRLVQGAQSTSNISNSLSNDFDLKASCSFVCLVWSCRKQQGVMQRCADCADCWACWHKLHSSLPNTQMEAPNDIQWWMDALSSIILIVLVSYSYMIFDWSHSPNPWVPAKQIHECQTVHDLCRLWAFYAVTIGCLTPEISKDCYRRSPQAAIFHGLWPWWPWMPWQITTAIRFRFRMATGCWRRDLICHPDMRFRTTEITEITEVHLDLTWILLGSLMIFASFGGSKLSFAWQEPKGGRQEQEEFLVDLVGWDTTIDLTLCIIIDDNHHL